MQVETCRWQNNAWESAPYLKDANLVIYFADPNLMRKADVNALLKESYPNAEIVGCSSGGEIFENNVSDETLVASALKFGTSKVATAQMSVTEVPSPKMIGRVLIGKLPKEGLKAVFVLADGVQVNGTQLVAGLKAALPEDVLITGGLAGDGASFKETYVGLNNRATPGNIVIVGFYGDKLLVTSGSRGGWKAMGASYTITKSMGNVLYTLNGENALDVYKSLIGPEDAAKLPGSGLLYPFSIRETAGDANDITRTIVGIDEQAQSLIFAGDMPEGWQAQLMSASTDNLSNGAADSAAQAQLNEVNGDTLAVMVSCIGRKLLMGELVGDEAQSVMDQLPVGTTAIGFYSYGEIAPHGFTGQCQLHNQTMTITHIGECA